MKWLFVILSGLLLLKPLTPFVEYAINKDYIASELCINVDKPQMHCDGKCYLVGNLEDEMDQESPAKKNSTRIQTETIVVILEKVFQFDISQGFISLNSSIFNFYLFGYSLLLTVNIFSPPWWHISI